LFHKGEDRRRPWGGEGALVRGEGGNNEARERGSNLGIIYFRVQGKGYTKVDYGGLFIKWKEKGRGRVRGVTVWGEYWV